MRPQADGRPDDPIPEAFTGTRLIGARTLALAGRAVRAAHPLSPNPTAAMLPVVRNVRRCIF